MLRKTFVNFCCSLVQVSLKCHRWRQHWHSFFYSLLISVYSTLLEQPVWPYLDKCSSAFVNYCCCCYLYSFFLFAIDIVVKYFNCSVFLFARSPAEPSRNSDAWIIASFMLYLNNHSFTCGFVIKLVACATHCLSLYSSNLWRKYSSYCFISVCDTFGLQIRNLSITFCNVIHFPLTVVFHWWLQILLRFDLIIEAPNFRTFIIGSSTKYIKSNL